MFFIKFRNACQLAVRAVDPQDCPLCEALASKGNGPSLQQPGTLLVIQIGPFHIADGTVYRQHVIHRSFF